MAQINVYGAPGGTSRACIQYHSGMDVQLGIQHVNGRPADLPPDASDTWNVDGGLWHDLDRSGINNLIRALREARDRAYGRDE